MPSLSLSNKKIVRSVSFPWQYLAAQNGGHCWDHHESFIWSVGTSTPYSDLPLSHFHLFSPLQEAYEDTFLCMMGHCRMLHSSHCNGRRQTSVRHKHRHFLEGERRLLLAKMETILKNNCALSMVVAKLCEIFMCMSPTEHEIKNRRHYFLTDLHIKPYLLSVF